jgi:hypothetical protein
MPGVVGTAMSDGVFSFRRLHFRRFLPPLCLSDVETPIPPIQHRPSAPSHGCRSFIGKLDEAEAFGLF